MRKVIVVLFFISLLSTFYFLSCVRKNKDDDSAGSSAPVILAPSSLSATAISSIQIDLTWTDNSNNEDGFKIERSQSQGLVKVYSQVATATANTTFYADSGLAVSTTYYYRIRGYLAETNSNYSNMVSATTLSVTDPSSLVATAVSATQIDLTWIDNSTNETGFKIERRIIGETFSQIDTVGAGITSYSNTPLSPTTTYYYRLRAYNTGGGSNYSNEANATTLGTVPSAPSSLMATVVSSTQINLVWTDNSDNETGFLVECKQGIGGTYSQIGVNGPNETSGSAIDLSPNTEYYFRVRAYNTGGNSGYSNEANATTLGTEPSAPSSLSATATSSTQINLSWTDTSSNEDGFKIERKTGLGGTYAQINIVGAGITSYANTSLTEGTAYYYRVRAYNVIGNSGYSNDVLAITLLKPPTSLSLTIASSSQINLLWTDNSSNESGFEIERGITNTAFGSLTTVAANVISYTDTTATVGPTYYYRIRAYNATCNSIYSNESAIAIALNAPTLLNLTVVSSTRIDLSWTDNSDNESGFKIERGVTNTSFSQIDTVGTNITSYSNTNLADGTLYYYRVRAYNVGTDSNYSNEPQAATILNPPSSLTLTVVSSARIDLRWIDNSNAEDSFKIERKTTASGTYVQIDTVSANITSYSDASLTDGTTYYYQVRASNATGNSTYSAENNATTPLNPPSLLTATAISSSRIDLSWTDNSNAEDSFKIERKTALTGTYVQIDTVSANITSYSNTALTDGMTYYYQIRASNATGNSTYSAPANATTPLNPSSLLTTTAVSLSQIVISWTDNSNNETGFEIERGITNTAFALITTTNLTIITDTGLTDGTSYYYRVRAYNDISFSDYSNESYATPPLNPPSLLTATAISSSRIDLFWTDNSNSEDGFKIERKTTSSGTYAQIDTASSGITSYSDTLLSSTTTYYYRIKAYNIGSNSDYSNEVCMLTSWGTITTTAAPVSRSNHTVLWTGDRMLVWGGWDGQNTLNTGGVYSPTIDTWTAITTTGAPASRTAHSAVWTGSKMIIWGGYTVAASDTQTLDNCESAWSTNHPNITTSTSTDSQEGTNSAKIDIALPFTTGVIAYSDLASPLNISARTLQKGYITAGRIVAL